MKRYYSKEHNRLMLCPKMDEPIKPIRETYEYMDDLIADEYNYNGFLEAYNTWLSSSLEIIGEHNWKDLQEVVEGVDYVIKRTAKFEAEVTQGTIRLVAIPKKEKENYLPNVQSNNEASVASHSCTVGNSIEQDFDDDEDNFQPCSNCDLPDACFDFGCAIKNGVRKDYPIDGVF